MRPNEMAAYTRDNKRKVRKIKKTLQKINELMDLSIIEKYAIAGGIAHFYYIEPSVTYDLDLVVSVPNEENELSSLGDIYNWAIENNYTTVEEHIIIERIPARFLLAYNNLVVEALENRLEISLFKEKHLYSEPNI